MKVMTLMEFHDAIRAQGVPIEHVAFTCPMCGTIQSATDLIKVGAGNTFEEVEKYLAYSCVGRFTNAGPPEPNKPPGSGCDWTLGGLFQLHKLEVENGDGKRHPRFEVCTPEEAQTHMKKSIHGSLRSSV